MRINLRCVLFTILITVAVASAQTAKKTITNDDLEKFRQSRLQAEKDLRENYAKLGFPSPEEMQRQEEQAQTDRENLSDKLRRERLAREQLQQDYLLAQQNSAGNVLYVQNYDSNRSYPMIYSGAFYKHYRGYRRVYPNGTYLPGGGYFGPTFNPRQGIQINTTPIQINTGGPTRPPVRIRTPEN